MALGWDILSPLITKNNPPFNIVLAADTFVHGRSCIRLFTRCPRAVSCLDDMILSVASDVDFSVVGYYIHGPCDVPPQQHVSFGYTSSI